MLKITKQINFHHDYQGYGKKYRVNVSIEVINLKQRWKNIISAGILVGCFLTCNLSAMASDGWTLPESGIRFDGEEKNAYVSREMDKFFHPERVGDKPAAVSFIVPKDWDYQIYDVGGLKLEKLENSSASTSRVVLKLHGGGYVAGLHDRHRQMGYHQALMTGAKELYMVNYRLAPEYPFPAALEDAAKAYSHILDQGIDSRNIIVIGDSAGGNLALELSVYLKEKELPQPGIMILISPWVTMATDMPSRQYNAERDLVLGKNASPLGRAVEEPAYAKGMNLKDPRISPLYANLKGFPPMLIQVGGYEIFLDECVKLTEKAALDEVDVTLTIYPQMPHEFPLMLPDLDDSIASFHEVRDFTERHMRK